MKWTRSRSSSYMEMIAWVLRDSKGPGQLPGVWPEQLEERGCAEQMWEKAGGFLRHPWNVSC